ncbi:MAG: hypothetical protein K6E36_04950 [Oscillospiraceae bacterium]|nr:hypothetical protein [Oscillospiraceae bacterium]MCR5305832.1 hypothetical protein [Oscillospiraceae bacterium]
MKQIKRVPALLLAAAMLSLAACREQQENSAVETTSPPVPEQTTVSASETRPQQTVLPPDAEEPVSAQPGDAFLYIADGSFGISYDGTANERSLLRYGAFNAKITGNGSYTVGVDCTDKAFQYEISNGKSTAGYRCVGLQFAAVRIADGAARFPEITVKITEIRVDGRAIPLTAENYTAAESGAVCANIYHPWIRELPADARSFSGERIPEGGGGYAAQIVSPDSFRSWEKVEVDFTVSNAGSPN